MPSVPGPASAASASSTVIGLVERRVGAARDRASAARRLSDGFALLLAASCERRGHHDQRDERRRGDAQRHRGLAVAMPSAAASAKHRRDTTP